MALDDTTGIVRKQKQPNDARIKKILNRSLSDAMDEFSQGEHMDISINRSPKHIQALVDLLKQRPQDFENASPENLLNLSQEASETAYKNEAIEILNANSGKSVAMRVTRIDNIDDLPLIMRAKYDAALTVARNINSINAKKEYSVAFKGNLKPIIQNIHDDLQDAVNNETVTYNQINFDDDTYLKLAEALENIDPAQLKSIKKDKNTYHQALTDIQAITMMHGKPYGFSSKAKAINAKVAQHVESNKGFIKKSVISAKSAFSAVTGSIVAIATKLKIKRPLNKAVFATTTLAALVTSCAFNTVSDATAQTPDITSNTIGEIALQAQENFDNFTPSDENAVSDAYLMTRDFVAGAIETVVDASQNNEWGQEAFEAALVTIETARNGEFTGEFGHTAELIEDGSVAEGVPVTEINPDLANELGFEIAYEYTVTQEQPLVGNADLTKVTADAFEFGALNGTFSDDSLSLQLVQALELAGICGQAMKDLGKQLQNAMERDGTLYGVQEADTLTEFIGNNAGIQHMFDALLGQPDNVLSKSQMTTLTANNIGKANNINMNQITTDVNLFIPGFTALEAGLNHTQSPSPAIIADIIQQNAEAGLGADGQPIRSVQMTSIPQPTR